MTPALVPLSAALITIGPRTAAPGRLPAAVDGAADPAVGISVRAGREHADHRRATHGSRDHRTIVAHHLPLPVVHDRLRGFDSKRNDMPRARRSAWRPCERYLSANQSMPW